MSEFRKAIAAGLSTGVAIYVSLTGSGAHVDLLIELGAALGGAIAAGIVVYLTPNAAPVATPKV